KRGDSRKVRRVSNPTDTTKIFHVRDLYAARLRSGARRSVRQGVVAVTRRSPTKLGTRPRGAPLIPCYRSSCLLPPLQSFWPSRPESADRLRRKRWQARMAQSSTYLLCFKRVVSGGESPLQDFAG